MPNKPHCLLLGNAGPRESSYDRHARAMERKMRETYAPKETVPVARFLCRHVVCHLSAFLFHFREKWSQSRDKRSCVATPSFNRERDLICSGIHICQRKRRLAKPTALADGNFKGNAHPRRLGFELFPYQRFFFRRDLVFVFRTVRSDAEFRARISSREFPRDRLEHNDAPNADIEECALLRHTGRNPESLGGCWRQFKYSMTCSRFSWRGRCTSLDSRNVLIAFQACRYFVRVFGCLPQRVSRNATTHRSKYSELETRAVSASS